MRNPFSSRNPRRARTNSAAFLPKLRLTLGSGVKLGATRCGRVSRREKHGQVTGEVQSTRRLSPICSSEPCWGGLCAATASPAWLSTASILSKLVRALGRKPPAPGDQTGVDNQPFRKVCEKRLPWSGDIFCDRDVVGSGDKGVNCIKGE